MLKSRHNGVCLLLLLRHNGVCLLLLLRHNGVCLLLFCYGTTACAYYYSVTAQRRCAYYYVLTRREVVDRFPNNDTQDTPECTHTVFTEDNTEKEEDHRSISSRSPETECHPFEKTTNNETTPKIANATRHRDRIACWMEGATR